LFFHPDGRRTKEKQATVAEAEQREEADRQRKLAKANLIEAEKQRTRAQERLLQAKRAVDDYFTRVSESSLLEVPAFAPLREELLKAALNYYADFVQQQPDDPLLRIELAATYFRVMQIQFELARWPECVESCERGVKILEAVQRDGGRVANSPVAQEGIWNLNVGHHLADISKDPRTLLSLLRGIPTLVKLNLILEDLIRTNPGVPGLQKDLAGLNYFVGTIYWWARLHDNAIYCLERARQLCIGLVRAFPKSRTYRSALVSVDLVLGRVHRDAGRLDRAETAFRQALEHAGRPHAEANFDLGNVLSETGRLAEAEAFLRMALELGLGEDRYPSKESLVWASICCSDLGNILCATMRWKEAVEYYSKGIHYWEMALQHKWRGLDLRPSLGTFCGKRAWALTMAGQFASALKDWDRAIELNPAEKPYLRARRAFTLAQAGEHAKAIGEAKALAEASGVKGERLFYLAHVCAVASTAVKNNQKLREQYAAYAIDLLRKAIANGYKDTAHMREDKDLDPLRSRDDFKKLLVELDANSKSAK
jgi:tetratricopeptide (TPR) repeat protein